MPDRDAGPRARVPWGALLFAMVFPTAAAWVYFVGWPGAETLAWLYAAGKVVQFGWPLLWLALGRTHRWTHPASSGLRGAGWLSGVGMGALIVAVYAGWLRGDALMDQAAPRVAERLEAFGATSLPGYLALSVFLSGLHSFLEEYYWRGFVHGGLRDRVGVVGAIVISSLAFAGHHAVVLHAYFGWAHWGWTLCCSLGVATGGAVWAALYERTGRLSAPWISHLIVDAAIMAVGYDLVRG